MACFIELLKCIICCGKEHAGDSYQAAHENPSYTQIPSSSTLSRDASQFKEEEDANNWNPVLFNALGVQGSSSSVNNSTLSVKPPDVTPEPIRAGGIINRSLTPIGKMRPSSSRITPPLFVSLPVKPPDVTPEPMLPSALGILPLPSFPHLSNPPKETNYVWAENGTKTHEVPEDSFKTMIRNGIIPGVLKKPLSPLTYREYFAALLYAEEYCTKKSSECRLSDVTLQLHKMEDKYFVAFEIVPERQQFFLTNDHVLIKHAGNNGKPFKGRLHRVTKGKLGNLMFVEFGVDFHSTYSPELKYDVRFSFSGVKRCQQAVETAMDPLFLQAFLFPNQASRARDLNPTYLIPCYQNVDYVQGLAIYRISIIKNPPPYLIEGPLCVTCDKKLSRTGLVIQQAILRICEVSPGCRILINAPTNKTCDVLMRSLKEKIPESAMIQGDYEVVPLCTLQEGCFTYHSFQELKSFKVISSTYVNSVRLRMEGIHSGHFSHIFLLDASIAIEPEIMISLVNLASPETVVVLSGCSTKNPTRIRSNVARWNGLKLSYFERLLGREPYRSRDPAFITCIDEII